MATPAMRNVTVLVRPYDDPVPADLHDFDLITFFFAYHDTTYMAVDRAKMDKALFAALKPGGFLVIADHSALPEDGATVGKKYHRIAEQTLRARDRGRRLQVRCRRELSTPSGGRPNQRRVPQSDTSGRIRAEVPEAAVGRKTLRNPPSCVGGRRCAFPPYPLIRAIAAL